jgi:hypothetical protein
MVVLEILCDAGDGRLGELAGSLEVELEDEGLE